MSLPLQKKIPSQKSRDSTQDANSFQYLKYERKKKGFIKILSFILPLLLSGFFILILYGFEYLLNRIIEDSPKNHQKGVNDNIHDPIK